MLCRLAIRDFVIVDRLELDFGAGFAVLTGETGAGKSILVDALAFLLGERADATLVRPGSSRAEVSAEFDLRALPGVAAALAEQDIDAGEALLIRRVLDAGDGGGRSRAYLNGVQVTLPQLRQVTDQLVDIHGQHAHQSLLKADAQRALLDAYGGHADAVAAVAGAWQTWRAAHERWQQAVHDGAATAATRERLADEVAALEALAFTADEWGVLNQEQRRLAHAVNLVDGAQHAVDVLSECDGAIAGVLSGLLGRLEALCEFDAALAEPCALLRSADAEVAEAASQLRRYADRLDVDPGRLAEVDARIEAILACARRYRVEPEALPQRLADSRAALAELELGADLGALEQRATAARSDYDRAAETLSGQRRQAADALGRAVTTRMQELSLGGGRLSARLLPVDGGSAAGNERVEFLLAGLAGDEARPLAKVASGGELSRISLALQLELTRAASIPTLIFDEVDVGIGGGVAEVVGRLLRALGGYRQVLCVTHLPQVAAQAHRQWQVAKRSAGDGVVLSRVRELDAGERVEEIARMLGGVALTETTRAHAREMLAAASG